MLAWLKRERFTHPLAEDKAARKIVAGFSYRDACKTLEEANHWLGSINETAGFALQRRFELLDLLDQSTRKAQERVVDLYVSLAEDDAQEKRIWSAASAFWKLLGDGYLACARLCSDTQSVPASLKPELSLLAMRGLRALHFQVKWASLRYGSPRAEIWGECGRFVMLAESAGEAATTIDMFRGTDAQSSSNQEIVRLMLYWTAMPGGLSPIEQDIAERLVTHLAPKCRLSVQRADHYDYFFDLLGSRPPLRLVPSAPATVTTRYLDVTQARAALRDFNAAIVRSGSLPVAINWGPAAEPNVIVRVLRHLWTHWAKELPPRAAARRKSDESLDSVRGFDNVLNMVAPEDSVGANLVNAMLLTTSWIAEDVSPGGCGVVVPQGKGERLRVGLLVAVRTAQDPAWRVGIIRRVKEHNYRQHHVGIQNLTRSPLPMRMRTLTGARQERKQERAILLSDQPTPSGYLHVLARRDLFSGREAVEAVYGEHDNSVILEPGGVVESGHDFDWLQFKVPGVIDRVSGTP